MKDEAKDWTKEELIERYVTRWTPITIPVNITIHGQQTIFDMTKAEDILRQAETIAVRDCICRGKWHKCDSPLDVCLTLDDHARETMKEGARRISLAQALVILKRTHEAGLVHMAFIPKNDGKPEVICSCCSCCCGSLSAMIRFGIPDHVVASEYMAENNPKTCSNCGTCVERCQFHARQLIDGKLAFNQAKCFGCGLCTSTCPTKSVKLTERNAH